MLFQTVLLIVLQILLPLFMIGWLWSPMKDRLTWLLHATYGTAYLLFIGIVGQWSFLTLHARSAFALLFVASVVASAWRQRRKPWRAPDSPSFFREHGMSVAMAALFFGLSGYALSGYRFSEPPIDLRFPLGAGRWVVGQGGDNAIINHHNRNAGQRYALDVAGLNAYGARASGLFPEALDRYVIYRRDVLSPCDGAVTSVRGDLADNIPPQTMRGEPAGNHVVIDCGTAHVLLAHFAQGEVDVTVGQMLQAGHLLGKAGNSGNSTEPHLHIHAFRGSNGDYRKGTGVPMLFDGRFLVRNSVIARE